MSPERLPKPTRLALLVLLVGTRAFAQSEAPAAEPQAPGEAPSQPGVVRPVPLETPAPAYPSGEHGDQVVVIELTVTVDGSVADPKILSGESPFYELALDAVRGWRFKPAERDGKPVPARIRFELSFREPPPPKEVTMPETPAAPTAPAAQPKPKEEKEEEAVDVVVVGERPEPERKSLSRAEVREIPGTFGDPFRAIEIMPGVTPLATGIPYFYVRGAPPGNVGYYLDGIRVPLLYHFALGPSVIHPGLVERVDLYSGAYPARYGRYSGGIVAAETTPPRPVGHGEANVRLFDAGALLEGPLGEKGIGLAGGRYSYTGGLLSLIAPEVTLGYWDYQLRLAYDATERDRLGLFAFGSYDFFSVDTEDGVEEGLGTEFHRLDLRHERKVDASTTLKSAITFGYDLTAQESLSDDEVMVLDRMIAARATLEHRASEQALVRLGVDGAVDDYSIELTDEEESFPTRTDFVVGAWGDVVWQPERWFTITPGLRADLYGSGSTTAIGVDPRISARYQISRRVALRNALGIAHQPPSFVIPVPGFALGGLEDGLQRAFQTSAGVDWDVGADVTAEANVFQNVFFDLSDLLSLARASDFIDDEGLDTRLTGHTYGLELVVRRPLTEKLGGYFAYTLSRSLRSIQGYRFIASFDRSHVLHAALAYDLGRRWRAGTRFTLYTGVPASRAFEPTGPNGEFQAPSGNVDARSPFFYRVDIRLEKKWPIGTKGAWWSFIFEVVNATLHKETLEYECSASGCRGEEFGPVTIPSIGVEAAF